MSNRTDVTSRTFADLEQLLADLLSDVPDSRFLWCTAGTGFDTHVERCEGLLLGGASAPGFLSEPGGQCTLTQTRVLGLPAGECDPLESWVPVLESVSLSEQSLLVVTDEIDATVLKTLLINVHRETISCCVIGAGGLADISAFLKSGEMANAGMDIVKQLPLIDRVSIRRAASVIFSGEEQELEGAMSPVELIHVGGSDVHDLTRRLEFMRCAIRDEDVRQGHVQ
ncbi:MAG: hypothetical protein OSA98_24890 [Rubripirellula sp.]|nr:hypothetical protein [Rubripirellula sp.]